MRTEAAREAAGDRNGIAGWGRCSAGISVAVEAIEPAADRGCAVPGARPRRRTCGPGGARRGDPGSGRRRAAGADDVQARFPDQPAVESGHRAIRGACPDLRDAGHFLDRHGDRRSGRPSDCDVPDRAVSALAAAADRDRGRAARRNPEHHLRHLGAVRIRTIPAAHAAAGADPAVRPRARAQRAVRGSALRHRHAYRGPDPRRHGAPLRHLDFPRRLRGGAARAQGSRLWARVHHLGGGPQRGRALRAGRDHRRDHAGTRPRTRRNHGGDLRHRQRAPDLRLDSGARNHDLGHHRQRVHRSGGGPLHLLADRAGADLVRDHVHRAGGCALPAAAARTTHRSWC